MIKILETESTAGFASPVFFERTERIKERIVDCSREELIDLCFHQLGMLEKYQGFSERVNAELEEHLGYHEPL
jgi:hypothetical protein